MRIVERRVQVENGRPPLGGARDRAPAPAGPPAEMGLRERVRGKFPLFEKAEAAGVLATGNCLIVAPTGTGKSYIGRTILRNAALRGDPGVHVYLVPYRALAAEIYESFVRELAVEHGCEESVADGDAGTRGSFGDRGSSEDRGRSEERGSSGDRSGSEDRGTSGDRSNPEDRGSAEDRGALGVHSSARAQAEERGHSAARLDLPRLAPRVKIATGDHRDPFYPADTDILVATFERFSALLASPDLRLGRVVIDEVHLLADESRGPTLETLLVRLKTWKRPTSICALSAVISNPEHLAAWLGVPLVLGSAEDRTVQVEFRCEVAKDATKRLESELEEVLAHGEQAIIFCRSKADSQKVATDLRPLVSRHLAAADMSALREAAARAAADDEEAEDLLGLLSGGVAYHHAGLSRDARACVEAAFRNRHLKVISCTPTLAAGVNLPARLVVVKDIYRMEFIRGRPRRVVLSTGELLNMLGRAGRPGQVEAGWGVALVEPGLLDEHELTQLRVAIRDARGNPVRSRLPDSFDSLMRFLLTVISDRGEATLQDAVEGLLPGGPLRPLLEGRVREVLVDEYQDLNRAQEALLKSLRELGANLTVVGDDDQAIYQWRGGDVSLFVDFPSRHGGTTATLAENHRSAPSIVRVSAAFAAIIEPRVAKTMVPSRPDCGPRVERRFEVPLNGARLRVLASPSPTMISFTSRLSLS
ncbi:MAG: UvrD-helicase domain-containing protein [Bacillota bacterium]